MAYHTRSQYRSWHTIPILVQHMAYHTLSQYRTSPRPVLALHPISVQSTRLGTIPDRAVPPCATLVPRSA
eukprot:2849877-Rhodomonas_salina.1